MGSTIRLYYDTIVAIALMAAFAIVCGFCCRRDYRRQPARLHRRGNCVSARRRGLVFPPLAQFRSADRALGPPRGVGYRAQLSALALHCRGVMSLPDRPNVCWRGNARRSRPAW